MVLKYFLLLSCFFFIAPVFGYGGSHGTRFPYEAEKCLRVSGYSAQCDNFLDTKLIQPNSIFNGMKRIDIIAQGCMLPDLVPLTDNEVNTYSTTYKTDHPNNPTYNFSSLVTQTIGNLLNLVGLTSMADETTVGGTYSLTYDHIKAWLAQTYYFPTIQIKVTYPIVSQLYPRLPSWYVNVTSTSIEPFVVWTGVQAMTTEQIAFLEWVLKTSTQHTYTLNKHWLEGSITKSSINDGGECDATLPITIAPWAAEAEYNMAIDYWKNKKDEGNALLYLGRAAHYIQDITVPHHCETTGNYPDLIRGLVMARWGEYMQTSQGQYEGDYFDGTGEYVGKQYVFSEGEYGFNPSAPTNFGIKKVIQMIQQAMLQPIGGASSSNVRPIIQCDGVPMYWYFDWSEACLIYDGWEGLARGFIYPKYMRFPLEAIASPSLAMPSYVAHCVGRSPCGGTKTSCEQQFIESANERPDWLYWVGANDEFKTVADFWASRIAVNYTAILFARFFLDVGLFSPTSISNSVR